MYIATLSNLFNVLFMKAYFFFSLVFLFGISNVYGQKNESVLWEISGNGISKKSYIFGTMHTSSVDLLNAFPKLNAFINGSSIGLFEITGKVAGNPQDGNRIGKKLPQPPLDSIFTPEEYLLVDSFFSQSPLGSIRPHNKDADLGGMLQVIITYKSNKGKQYISLDSHLKQVMEGQGKELFQLDEVDDSSKKAFNSQYRLIAEGIVSIIKQSDDAIGKDPWMELYRKSLEADLQLNKSADKVLAKVTVERNKIWLPKIIDKIRENSCFIAVGFGHLQYKDGLIVLLKQKGYHLKPISLF